MSSNNTRNPHHNRWGGKNNTWGNRNRKKKTANSQYNGGMSKIGGATWKSISPTVRTDAGVLERRQAQRRWSGREQDGVASEHNGALPQRGRFGSSITPNLCVLCYSLQPHCLQAFPTSYSFTSPCVRVEKHEHFLFPHFFHFFLKE